MTEKTKTKRSRTIKVGHLARVEGEGGLFVKVKDNKVKDVRLNIFEPPRFFEALLCGRSYTEAPDITARICGICPVAYQMSAVHAMENVFGTVVDGPLRALRRLLYCAEWIESHTLHVYMLHAPDFLGFESAIAMAREFPKEVERGLQLKKVGNELLAFLGGREIHPINVQVGGFYRTPLREEFQEISDRLRWASDAAYETLRWVSEFSFPEFEMDYEFVSLSHPDEYPMNEGRVVSNRGLDIDVSDYEKYFTESQVEHSTALHSKRNDSHIPQGNYLVGPMARYNLNFEKLSPKARDAAEEVALPRPCKNPFKSIIVRSVEILHACEEALEIIGNYKHATSPAVSLRVRPGLGHSCTEAPRGLLYHRYLLDEKGEICEANIVPPTSQNQATIEEDLRVFVEDSIDLPKKQLQHRCEQIIRNYDPCISCSTHFLQLQVTEG